MYFSQPTARASPAASRAERGEAVSVEAHVGRNCPLEQDSLACKRSFLFWQGANDTATLPHPYNSTTAGKAQRPKHPPTFTHHRRQGHSGQFNFACRIARPQPGKRLGNGHPAPTGLPCRPTPLDLPASRQANQSPGSALRRGTVAGGDSRASHPDRNVHRPKTTRAGKTPRQATRPDSPNIIFFKVLSIRAQRSAHQPQASRAQRGEACRLDAHVRPHSTKEKLLLKRIPR